MQVKATEIKCEVPILIFLLISAVRKDYNVYIFPEFRILILILREKKSRYLFILFMY
jgi:hypothetical protein